MPECLNRHSKKLPCAGPVEYRMPLSGTGKSFPRCVAHWKARLEEAEAERERDARARLVDYLDAGERYDEDDA